MLACFADFALCLTSHGWPALVVFRLHCVALASAYGGSRHSISLGVRELSLDETVIEMATIFFSILDLDPRGLVQARQVLYHRATSSCL